MQLELYAKEPTDIMDFFSEIFIVVVFVKRDRECSVTPGLLVPSMTAICRVLSSYARLPMNTMIRRICNAPLKPFKSASRSMPYRSFATLSNMVSGSMGTGFDPSSAFLSSFGGSAIVSTTGSGSPMIRRTSCRNFSAAAPPPIAIPMATFRWLGEQSRLDSTRP
jgi:hypothetical protein